MRNLPETPGKRGNRNRTHRCSKPRKTIMALVNIKGYVYYTRSVRRNGRVTSESYGSGELAELCYRVDQHTRERRALVRAARHAEHREAVQARQERRAELRSIRERYVAADRTVEQYGRRVGRLVEAIMGALGYHRPDRCRWRRK